MVPRKMTPEEVKNRVYLIEDISKKIEDINCMLKLMASCYTSKCYDFDECTNKKLERFLKGLYKEEEKLEKFRDRYIPDEIWEFAEC